MVVSTVPSPLKSTAPPSITRSLRNTGRPRAAATRVGTASSASHGGYLPPQALKPQSTMAVLVFPRRVRCTNAGPWSRVQHSLVGMWKKRTFERRVPAARSVSLTMRS